MKNNDTIKGEKINFFIKDPGDDKNALPIPIPPPSLFGSQLPCCPLTSSLINNVKSTFHYFKPIYLSRQINIESINTTIPVHRILKVPSFQNSKSSKTSLHYVVRPSLFNTYAALSPAFQYFPHVLPTPSEVVGQKKLKHYQASLSTSNNPSIPSSPLTVPFCINGKRIEKLNSASIPYEPKWLPILSQRKLVSVPFKSPKRPHHSLYSTMDAPTKPSQNSTKPTSPLRGSNGASDSASLTGSNSDASTIHNSFSFDSYGSMDTSLMSLPSFRNRLTSPSSSNSRQGGLSNSGEGKDQIKMQREEVVVFLQKEQDTLISFLLEWLRQHSDLNALLMPFIENLHFLCLLYLEEVSSLTNDRFSEEFLDIQKKPQLYFLKFSWNAYCLLKTFPPLFTTTSLLPLIHLDETSPLTLIILQQTLGSRIEDPFVKSVLLYFHMVWSLSPIKAPWESALCFLPVLTEKEWYHQVPVREYEQWLFPSKGTMGTEYLDEIAFQTYLNTPTKKINPHGHHESFEKVPQNILEKCAKLIAFMVLHFREISSQVSG
ncbi:hypothetical protein HMI54_002010 [Coelomomyces lativittatus]|nr:hypothetical protein HMI56_006700 [Coelomomyces lativittatus]KAJ1509945.1 hypothetical protein HMI54_002010 [Coelomomyces lativittatus]